MQVFPTGMDRDTLVLYAARASRIENQDAIDASIVGMLGDPKEVLIKFLLWTLLLPYVNRSYKIGWVVKRKWKKEKVVGLITLLIKN